MCRIEQTKYMDRKNECEINLSWKLHCISFAGKLRSKYVYVQLVVRFRSDMEPFDPRAAQRNPGGRGPGASASSRREVAAPSSAASHPTGARSKVPGECQENRRFGIAMHLAAWRRDKANGSSLLGQIGQIQLGVERRKKRKTQR